MKNEIVTTQDAPAEVGAATAVTTVVEIPSLVRVNLAACDDRLNNEAEVAGYGATEKDARADLEYLQELFTGYHDKKNSLKCDSQQCSKGGKCVFDWATIGNPKCEELPATKSKKHKITVPKTFVCRQKVRYGCLCDRSA